MNNQGQETMKGFFRFLNALPRPRESLALSCFSPAQEVKLIHE